MPNTEIFSIQIDSKESLHYADLKKYYWKDPVFWSRSYCIMTCGGAQLSIIKRYIEQQSGVGSNSDQKINE